MASNCVLRGVGPEAPVVTNAAGGRQSLHRWRFDLIDAHALFVLGRILDYGARKYGANNWRRIPVEDHINAAVMHFYAYLAGDRQDDHLGHALARATFALGVALADGYVAVQPDEREAPGE